METKINEANWSFFFFFFIATRPQTTRTLSYYPLITLSVCVSTFAGVNVHSLTSVRVCACFYVALGHMDKSVCKQERRVSERENMIIFVWVNELLTRVARSLPAKVWEAFLLCVCVCVCVCVFGMYSMYRWGYGCGMCINLCVFRRMGGGWVGGGLSRGHCLVKLKEERWHAVSLSWRSPLNALAPPDTFYSDQGDRRAPPACRGIPPFNWAFTQDSFHSAPRASLGADKTMRVTKLGLTLFRLRGWWNLDLHKKVNL